MFICHDQYQHGGHTNFLDENKRNAIRNVFLKFCVVRGVWILLQRITEW